MAHHLIIGGDGLVGSSVASWLRSRGESVAVTTRRRMASHPSRIFLDMEKLDGDWKIADRPDTIFLCAGHNPKQCVQDPERSRQVNVLAPLEIVRALADKDTFVVKLSSNAVFDGQSPRQPACGPYRPQILYGEQHRELDERLMGLGIGAAIVRFAKVMAPQVPIFDSWIEAWSRNQVVRPLKDLSLAPISLPFIVELIARAGLTRESGIFQASGDQDVSYAQACLAAAGCLDVSRELVRPATVEELGLKLDWHPLHTTLDMTETTRLFRVTPPTIDDVVKVLAPSPLASLS